MRIAKYLASCGLGARRKCEDLVTKGLIKVNDVTVNQLSFNLSTDSDKVFFNGKEIIPQKKVYYLLNKPVGYTTTLSDPYAEKVLIDLVPNTPPVWPVGRLDKDTSGLIILTNDGELTQKLTHPKYKKEKEYLAVLDKQLTKNDIEQIKEGIELDDGFIKPDSINFIGKNQYQITIHEGRKRIVRRIFKHFGSTVISLKRIRISELELKGIEIGSYRELTEKELEKLSHA